jgi:hypothetical protein
LASKPHLLTALLALFVYYLTLAPGLTWSHFGDDGGDLITAATTFGVPHPPGYPVFVILGRLISYLPIGSVAHRFNLFSAISVAVASGFITALLRKQMSADGPTDSPRANVSALTGGLAFAFAPLVWGQAVITEVYGMNLAVLAAFLWALFGHRKAWQTGLLLGLGIAIHLTSLLMLPAAILVTPRKNLPQLGIGAITGLTPLLTIPWMASSGSPIIWGDPTTAKGWWWLVSAQLYQGNVFTIPASHIPERVLEWSQLILAQYSLAAPALIALSLYRLKPERRLGFATLLVTALLYTAYSLGYNSNDAIVYLLPGLMLVPLLIAPALHSIGRFALLLPLSSLLLNFGQLDLRHDTSIRSMAEHLLDRTPANAILITPGDASIFALWYYHHVEAVRPDLTLVDRNLFAFDWYRRRLASYEPDLRGLAVDDLEAFRMANRGMRPYCEVGPSLSTEDMGSLETCAEVSDP